LLFWFDKSEGLLSLFLTKEACLLKQLFSILVLPDPSRIFISPQNATKNESQRVVFECNLEGKPLSSVTWWHGQIQVNTSESRYVVNNPNELGRRTARLTIMNLLRGDEGFYRCKVDNNLHTEFSVPAYLTVQCKWAEYIYL
jgi:hypothetical protein